ncbi:phosphate regulon sensor histidine kinase PhoR [Endozoicomonas sp. (ex Bugula neritina AB1)]|nr:phosphate regulon sensor histidine kinase PhoR [Endozoicomonas sp. (ex Bugula neritina AB1)]
MTVTSSNRSHFTGRMLLLLALGLLAGWSVNKPFLGLFAGSVVYLIWSHYQLHRLLEWIDQSAHKELEPPESSGVWGEIFDGIYRVQRRQKLSRQRLASVIERIQDSTAALSDGVLMADKQGILEWWNRAAEDLLGLQMPNDRGQLLTNLVRDPKFIDYLENSVHREPIEMVSSGDRQLQISITVYGEGNRLMLIRDVTRLHQLETMRKDFVANVSHELRTPLTVISGYLETFIDSAGDSVPPVWNKALNRMQEQAVRMQTLVSDLLLLSKLEATSPTAGAQQFELRPLLSGIIDDAKALSGTDGHQFTLECDDDAEIIGDSSELRSAFSNLAYNAVRYTPAGGQITVRWWQDYEGGHLLVKDNGVGIDPVHIPRLTERFYRVDKSRSHNTGGTGLGLAIVKHVLLRHDGQMSISSLLGKGSRFKCHFPKERVVVKVT